jgi:hypothetical protein
MEILKKSPRYKYTEKRCKNNSKMISARLTGPIEEVINTRTPAGQVIEHETNKHISNNFKKNYEEIKWDDKNHQLKSSKKKLNKLTQIYKNN